MWLCLDKLTSDYYNHHLIRSRVVHMFTDCLANMELAIQLEEMLFIEKGQDCSSAYTEAATVIFSYLKVRTANC